MKTDIQILERLITCTCDTVNGYEEAAQLVHESNMPLAKFFQEKSSQRLQLVNSLCDSLARLDPDNQALRTDGSIRGTLHQYFMYFCSVFQTDKDAALDEIEYEERYLIKTYQEESQNASASLRSFIEDALEKLQNQRYSIEMLRKVA